MKLSVKSDYAARAVLGLARHYAHGAAVRVEDLAAEQGIPGNYLVQILIELKAQGIARSLRGKEGGYLLAKTPAEISLGDVLRAVHGVVFDTPALSDPDCPPELRRAWQRLKDTLERAADSTTFQKLLEESTEKDKMYYIRDPIARESRSYAMPRKGRLSDHQSREGRRVTGWSLTFGARAKISKSGRSIWKSPSERLHFAGVSQNNFVWLVNRMDGTNQPTDLLAGNIAGNDHAPGLLQGKVQRLQHERHGGRKLRESGRKQAKRFFRCIDQVSASCNSAQPEDAQGSDGVAGRFGSVIIFFCPQDQVGGVGSGLPKPALCRIKKPLQHGVRERKGKIQMGRVQNRFVQVQDAREQECVSLKQLDSITFPVPPPMEESFLSASHRFFCKNARLRSAAAR